MVQIGQESGKISCFVVRKCNRNLTNSQYTAGLLLLPTTQQFHQSTSHASISIGSMLQETLFEWFKGE
jgi:hypothetical protein